MFLEKDENLRRYCLRCKEYKQGRRCHEPRSLRNSYGAAAAVLRDIYYYYVIQWVRGINKR